MLCCLSPCSAASIQAAPPRMLLHLSLKCCSCHAATPAGMCARAVQAGQGAGMHDCLVHPDAPAGVAVEVWQTQVWSDRQCAGGRTSVGTFRERPKSWPTHPPAPGRPSRSPAPGRPSRR
eukprot:357337-Chlamydomonas_euryale.AAC.2